MTVLLVMLAAVVVLAGGGWLYSSYVSRKLGQDPSHVTPAVAVNDGRDFVPTPTPVVFAHHFASIAGAGPILGPVLAIVYGWVPALLWVVFGGVFIGGVHDYLATFMATREGGRSVATTARRIIGKDAFVALTFLLVLMLALVCAAFLNASANALTNTVAFDRLGIDPGQGPFQSLVVEGTRRMVIGGVAFSSVIVITAMAPLVGWLYLKRKVAVWKCSVLAVLICGVSIVIGVWFPLTLGETVWKLLLSAYVLVAAGVPVWLFLQSRDFINVHILYVGMIALLVTLVVASARGGSSGDPMPALNIAQGQQALGPVWPMMFIVIACGAVSGFHSLCAGGTTCKQLNCEKATRQVGYYAMLLETFLAVCVIGTLVAGAHFSHYLADVHPAMAKAANKSDPALGFAMAVGSISRQAWGGPLGMAAGAIGGMLLLGGFLVTTLDTAIRLTRYLIEEIWRTFFGHYDVFASSAMEGQTPEWGTGEKTPVGADGIPIMPAGGPARARLGSPVATRGPFRWLLVVLRQYWVNSALAVGLMLAFAFTGGVKVLWTIFATSNQLLAAMVLSVASLWLLRQGRRVWFAILPAIAMLATTGMGLVLGLRKYLGLGVNGAERNVPLLVANIVIMAITAYLLAAGIRAAVGVLRTRRSAALA